MFSRMLPWSPIGLGIFVAFGFFAASNSLAEEPSLRDELAKIDKLVSFDTAAEAAAMIDKLMASRASELAAGSQELTVATLLAALSHVFTGKCSQSLDEAGKASRLADGLTAIDVVYTDLDWVQAMALDIQAGSEICLNRLAEVDVLHAAALNRAKKSGTPDSLSHQIALNQFLAERFMAHRYLAEAIKPYRAAADLARKLSPPRLGWITTTVNDLANVLFSLDRPDEALEAIEPVVALTESSGPAAEQIAGVAILYGNYARAMVEQQKFDLAEKAFRKSLSISKQIADFDPHKRAMAFVGLSGLDMHRGLYDDARKNLDTASAIVSQVSSSVARDETVAAIAGHRAELHGREGEFQKAVDVLQMFFKPDGTFVGPASQRGDMLSAFGTALAQANQPAEAEQALVSGLNEIKRTIGTASTSYERALNNLAWFYSERGRDSKAEPLLREAITVGGETTSETRVASLTNLGASLVELGQLDEGKKYYLKAVEIAEDLPDGPENPLPRILVKLCNIDEQNDDLDEAERLYKLALSIFRANSVGADNRRSLQVLYLLGQLARKRDDFAEARAYFLQSEMVRERLGIALRPNERFGEITNARFHGVYFATDRAPADEKGQALNFGSNVADKLSYGRASISVPVVHKTAGLELPTAAQQMASGDKLFQDIAQHLTISQPARLGEDKFVAAVTSTMRLASRFPRQALVYIHGFNVSFDSALIRMGQIVDDTGFDGAALVYSWASIGGISNYWADQSRASVTSKQLAAFLRLVANRIGADRIHIVVHSMGNQALVKMLKELEDDRTRKALHIGQLISAAPDVDAAEMQKMAAILESTADAVTIYASSNDKALKASRYAHMLSGFVARAGDVPSTGPLVMPGIETIDVSRLRTDGLNYNHSAYADTGELLKDIGALIEHNAHPPDRRGFKRVTNSGNRVYWRYDPE